MSVNKQGVGVLHLFCTGIARRCHMVFYNITLLALRCLSDKEVDWLLRLSGTGNLVRRAFSLAWRGVGKGAFSRFARFQSEKF